MESHFDNQNDGRREEVEADRPGPVSSDGVRVRFRHFDDPPRRAETDRPSACEGDGVMNPLILKDAIDDDPVVEEDDAEISSLPDLPGVKRRFEGLTADLGCLDLLRTEMFR